MAFNTDNIKEHKTSDGIEALLTIFKSFEHSDDELEFSKKQFQSEISEIGDNRIIYVAYDNGQPTVMVQLILKNADNDPDLANGKEIGHVHNLRVRHDLQRQGLGLKMMEFLEDRARERGITVLTLGVDDWNTGAVKLYESMGYVVFKEEPGRFENEKCLLMKKGI